MEALRKTFSANNLWLLGVFSFSYTAGRAAGNHEVISWVTYIAALICIMKVSWMLPSGGTDG